MGQIIYILCAATSLVCAVLLWRGYRASRARLLMWSTLCFGGLFVNNLMLVIDIQSGSSEDRAIWRTIPALIGIGFLLYGLIWDSEAS